MAVIILACVATPAPAAIVQLGILGDSLSYTDGSDYGQQPNWHTQLETAGRVAIGPTANQSADGATTADLAAQSSAIISLVQAQQLDFSVIAIGSNDATQMTIDFALNHVPIPADFSTVLAGRIAATISALEAADPGHHLHQIIANIPDITRTPALESVAAQLNISPQDIDAVRQAIINANSMVEATARAHGIPVLDLFKFLDDVGTQPLALAGIMSAPADLYSSDGFHPGPLLHGLTANIFLDAARRGYGISLDPLSDQDIASNAGLTPLAAGPSYFDVSPFVIVPEPPTAAMISLPALLLVGFLVRRKRAATV